LEEELAMLELSVLTAGLGALQAACKGAATSQGDARPAAADAAETLRLTVL
jgi:hypothetical protein